MQRNTEICIENSSLGIEFGSTRIKMVLIDDKRDVIAGGSFSWENKYENGIWTYSEKDIFEGLSECYNNLSENVFKKYGKVIKKLRAIGVSGMMHGYLAFDDDSELLVPFRTWRNTVTQRSSDILSELFNFNIPQRYSISHLYQAILNGESHVERIDYLTTLSGYVHYKLTGQKVLGIGDASGMFPVDAKKADFNCEMAEQFENLIKTYNYPWKLRTILPKVLKAGERAGTLTKEGTLLLDKSGNLETGIPFCPPEGDAQTGMVATNSVGENTGNVSAGTSIFAMIVLKEQLKNLHKEIDIVATPDGLPVAMVHCNNCTTEINAFAGFIKEIMQKFGCSISMDEVYRIMFESALSGDDDCGGLLAFNYHSGEHITKLSDGCPLFLRRPDSKFNFNNFMRAELYSALATLKIGMKTLEDEGVRPEKLMAHGGFFKTELVGQRILASAMNSKVSVMSTAGEGGAWGIALLAKFMEESSGLTLSQFLDNSVFNTMETKEVSPVESEVDGFIKFMQLYKNGLEVERKAVECLYN